MFVFEDKTSLRKLHERYFHQVRRYFTGVFVDTTDTFRRTGDVDIAAKEVATKKMWEFLEFAPRGYVLTSSGQMVELDQSIWDAPLEKYLPLNGLINIQSGLLQASDEHLWPWDRGNIKAIDLLAPFEGCPVYVSNDDDDLLFEDDGWIKGNSWSLLKLVSPMLDDELKLWFATRAEDAGVKRPVIVEQQYIDGEDESPDLPENGLPTHFPEAYLPIEDRQHRKLTVGGEATAQNSQVIADYVYQAFPNGKGDATWLVVETKVGYSRRSIVRALKQLGGYYDWARGGRNKE